MVRALIRNGSSLSADQLGCSPHARSYDTIGDHLRPTWCEVDLGAITRNFATLRDMLGPKPRIIPSLKRNANGCGVAAVARHLEGLGADGVCFGNIDDAIAARKAGVGLPILLYPTCLPDLADVVADLDLTLTLSTIAEVRA